MGGKLAILLLFVCFSPKAQGLLIPSVSFGYAIQKHEFLVKNYEKEQYSRILPELYLGCQFVDRKWMIGAKYGFLQNSIMLDLGFVIRFKKKRNEKMY